jgi:hypothetical protein
MRIKNREAACQIPLPIRCRPRFTGLNSAAGGLGKILDKMLMYNVLSMLSGSFSGAKNRFFPDIREKRPFASALTPRLVCAL